MPELVKYADNNSGRIESPGGAYATARDATMGDTINRPVVRVGQKQFVNGTTTYQLYRGFLFFDTRAIPSGAIIISAVLSIYTHILEVTQDFNVIIQNGQPSYPSDPLVLGDYNRTHYSGSGGSIVASSLILNQYNDITITELDWITKDGWTKLALRSSRDIDGNAPDSDAEIVYFYGGGGADKAKLTINYTYSGLPVFFQGGLTGAFGKKGFLVGDLTAQLQYFGWLFGNPIMQSFPKKPYIVGDAITTWGKKGFLMGSLNPYYGGGRFIVGTLTAIPYYPKPVAGSWFQRTEAVLEEIT